MNSDNERRGKVELMVALHKEVQSRRGTARGIHGGIDRVGGPGTDDGCSRRERTEGVRTQWQGQGIVAEGVGGRAGTAR